MQGDDSRKPDKTYGNWTWIVGLAMGALIIWLMFALATGFA